VRDAATLEGWLLDLFRYGSIRTDLILAACAARAQGQGRLRLAEMGTGAQIEEVEPSLAEVSELALALSPSRERKLETTQQGRSFLEAVCAAWPSPALDAIREASPEIAHPVAFGAAMTAHGLPLFQGLSAYALQFAANLVSAVVRLGVIGQTDGQVVIATLAGEARRAARLAMRSRLDDIGGAAFASDLASICHETKYSRIFRS
jgi:urease accessory protein